MRSIVLSSAVVLLWLMPGLASAQLARSESPVSVMDSYGNARPARTNRRAVGGYANDIQRKALGGYQNIGRRLDRRGGFANIVQSGGVAGGRGLFQTGQFSSGPMGRFSLAPSGITASRFAFNRYGGFSRRSAIDPEKVGDLLARRQELIAATTVNAPVHRALGQRGAFDPGLMSIGTTPFVPSDVPIGGDDAVPIADLLLESADAQTQRLVLQGWSWFAEKRYGQAYRSFESTLIVNPENVQARVGRVFSRLSAGAMRSAMTEIAFLPRHSGNPFAQPFVLAEKYHSRDEASQILFQTRLFAEQNMSVVVPQALYVYVQWYLGDKKEASRLAVLLSKRNPSSPYANWPALMQASLALPHKVVGD